MTIQINRSDLALLSKPELAALYRKFAEMERAQQYRSLEKYHETAHIGQIDFHKAEKRIRYFLGGNRSGKTTGGTVEMLWTLLGTHPYRKCRVPLKAVLVVQDFENHCKNIIEPKFKAWAPLGAIVRDERNQNGAWRKVWFSSGSVLDILSHDQDAKVFEGGDWDIAWFDEPPPKQVFTAIWRGLTDRGGLAYITATPITGPWMYQEIKKAEAGLDPLRWCIFVDMEQNAKNIGEGDEELGKKRIAEFVELLDPEERNARKTGQFLQMQGLIFKEWERAHHLIKPFQWPWEWPIIETIDPHPAKPWAVAWLGLTENKKKILIRSGKYPGVIDEVADSILYERTQLPIQHDRKPRIIRCLIDNYASAPIMTRSHSDPTARRRTIREELEAYIGPAVGGPRIEVAPKNVRQKIELFKALLKVSSVDTGKDSDFYVLDTPENQGFADEIENYVWDTKRGGILKGLKDVPLKENDDILDAVMQVVLTLPRENTSREIIRMASGNSYRI